MSFFVFFQFLLSLFPSFPVVPLSVCLSRIFPSVFVFPLYTGSGSNFNFCPRPCFGHLSTVQTWTPTQRTALYVQSHLSRPLYRCSHRMCIIAWAVSRGSHKQNDDMANYRMGSCTEEPSGRSEETASHSAPASLPLPFRIAPFVAPFSRWCSNCVPTVRWLCAVSLLLPRMLMVLLIFQMITVHASDSGSNAKMLCISATTLYAVWTSASCPLMF